MVTTAISIMKPFLLLPGQTRRKMMKNYTIAVAGTGYAGLSIAMLLSQAS